MRDRWKTMTAESISGEYYTKYRHDHLYSGSMFPIFHSWRNATFPVLPIDLFIEIRTHECSSSAIVTFSLCQLRSHYLVDTLHRDPFKESQLNTFRRVTNIIHCFLILTSKITSRRSHHAA